MKEQDLPSETSLDSEAQNTDKTDKKIELSKEAQEFLQKLEEKTNAQDKLTFALDYLEKQLGEKKGKSLRFFWEIRQVCLDLFKEPIEASERAKLWQIYHDLSIQARRLKEILQEESQFASEQINLAITSIENEVASLENSKFSTPVPELPKFLKDKAKFYNEAYERLQILNAAASRLNALRKEIIKTNMRFRKRTQLFDRLGAVGNQIFPERKKWIKKVSEAFCKDVAKFEKEKMASEPPKNAYFQLKEEIKEFQAFAKIITLNTQAFNETREKLSTCWDIIKNLEKEHKKSLEEKKDIFKENYDKIFSQIETLKQKFQSSDLPLEAMKEQFRQVTKEYKQIELGRKEQQQLKPELDNLRSLITQKQTENAKKIEAKQQQLEEEKNAKIAATDKSIKILETEEANLSQEELQTRLHTLETEIQGLDVSELEKLRFSRQLVPIYDRFEDRQDQAVLSQHAKDSSDYQQALKKVIKRKQERRDALKKELDNHKKALGSSGLDIEKSFFYNELIQEDKNRLAQIESSLENLDQ